MATQQRQSCEIILHRRPRNGKETGEFKQKIWDSTEISFQNKGTIYISREGYTKLILASAFAFFVRVQGGPEEK